MIQIGDLVFVDRRTSDNFIGRIIRVVENNGIYPLDEFMPNHVGIVIEEAENVRDIKVIGAFPPGPKIQSLSYWLDNPNVNTCVRTFRDFIPLYQRYTMRRWMYKYYKDKIPYDILSLVGILLKYLILQKVNNKFINFLIRYIWNDNIQNRVYLNCAELTYKIYKSVGLSPISFFPDYAFPSDYYLSKRWRTIYHNYNYDYPRY